MSDVHDSLATIQFDDDLDVDEPLVQDALVVLRVLDGHGDSWVIVRRSQGTDDMVAGGMTMEAMRQWRETREDVG